MASHTAAPSARMIPIAFDEQDFVVPLVVHQFVRNGPDHYEAEPAGTKTLLTSHIVVSGGAPVVARRM